MSRRLFGSALALVLLAACSSSTPSVSFHRAASIIAGDVSSNGVYTFSATATGNVAPTYALAGSTAAIGLVPGVFNDRHGHLWVSTCASPSSIQEFPIAATGNVASIHAITSAALNCPGGLGFDASGKLYATDSGNSSINVFSAGAGLNATPVATISGAATTLAFPVGMVVAPSGQIYVANANLGAGGGTPGILIFAPGATGNVSPSAMISGAATTLVAPAGIWFDRHGNIWVADNVANAIDEFAPNASGNVAPINTIVGANTTLVNPWAVAVDDQGYIYEAGGVTGGSINVFAPNATGNVAPIQTITGAATLLAEPVSLTIN